MHPSIDLQPLPLPERVTLELTNHCNLSCPVCPRHHMRYPLGFMDSGLFRRLTDELADLGTTTMVPFFRGEPLLHRHCLELLLYAKHRGFTIQLATNGLLLTEEIARGFVAMGIDFVSVSVDAIHAETYHERRRGGSLARLLEGFDHLLRARSVAHAILPRIQVSAVDTGMDERQKEEFIAFWQGRADRIRIYPQHSRDGRFGSLASSNTAPRQPCLKPFREMVIYWDGRIALCNHDWNGQKDFGSVGHRPLRDLWHGPAYSALRERQRHLNLNDTEICAGCGHWQQYCREPKMVGDLHSRPA